ncbi:hypothetical protein [Dyella sp.]|uniref:hypothetical protein n=1 Tax=Dyella sp. TaxID=1869338 RepID=UPI002D7E2D4F|nr:hypothetical protein [Dyella sp.]
MNSALEKSKSILFFCMASACLVSCHSGSSNEQAIGLQPRDCSEIDSAARDRLVSNTSKVQLGDGVTSVEALLGHPDKEWPLGNKKGDRTIGKEIYYFTKKCGDPNRVFEEDQFVNFWFDLNGRLISISTHGVNGVSNRPNLQPSAQ